MKRLFAGQISPVILDGGMGTQLALAGWRPPLLPEEMVLENPDSVTAIHRAYVEAGARIVETDTFGGSALKLAHRGLEGRTEEINRRAAELARQAVGDRAFVAGSMGPIGRLVDPLGDLTFDEAVEAFRPQAAGLARGGADFLLVETMLDLKEAQAAAVACREAAPGLPFAVSFTFDKDGSTVTGTPPEAAAVWAEAVGAFAVGANCGVGPEEYVDTVHRLAASTDLPVFVYPNAGVPSSRDYLGPEAFAGACEALVRAGAAVVGGCCGTTPEHTAALARRLGGMAIPPSLRRERGVLRFASRSRVVEAGQGRPLLLIGERINVSRKSPLREELRVQDYTTVRAEARDQTAAGAGLLDVNVGLPEIDRIRAMGKAIHVAEAASSLPLSVDSDDPTVLERGLREAVGVPLLNSVTAKAEALERGIDLAWKYGAVLAVLTIDESGIPERAYDRVAIAQRVLLRASERGLGPERILLDPLTLALGADPRNALATCEALRCIRELGGHTMLGISNISHGLPARGLLNRTFLVMAMEAGLDAVLCNPLDERLLATVAAADALRGRDEGLRRYLAFAPGWSEGTPASGGASRGEPAKGGEQPLTRCILEGDPAGAEASARALVDRGTSPLDLVSSWVVPALEEVGRLYECGDTFLPQLLSSAQAAGGVCRLAEELLARQGVKQEPKGTVVLATVEGDLHDLGKNVVGMVLASHGYRVVDLGKDVPAERILEAAEAERADVVGLSALMTSTVPQMEAVIRGARERGAAYRIIVGGAAVSPQYAESIGADGTSSDAVGAARLVEQLLARR